ncbi:MAG: DUF3499 family protein, partial [Actinomycetota bacterium]
PAGVRSCSKPGCASPAAAVLAYSYAERLATLEDAAAAGVPPHAYALCGGCAERLRPPRGWRVDDRRCTPPLFLDAALGQV